MSKSKVKPKSYALRIEAHLVEPLQKLKKRNRRSLNAEINAALDQWVAGSTKSVKASPAISSSSPSKSHSDSKERATVAAKSGAAPHAAAKTGSDPASNGASG